MKKNVPASNKRMNEKGALSMNKSYGK